MRGLILALVAILSVVCPPADAGCPSVAVFGGGGFVQSGGFVQQPVFVGSSFQPLYAVPQQFVSQPVFVFSGFVGQSFVQPQVLVSGRRFRQNVVFQGGGAVVVDVRPRVRVSRGLFGGTVVRIR